MKSSEKIKLVRRFHGALGQVGDEQVLTIAASLPPGKLEEYQEKVKEDKDANCKRSKSDI